MIDRRGVIGGGLAMSALPLAGARAAGREPVMNHIIMEDGRVWIAATIYNKPYLFVVDTGAFASMIDDSFAKSLHLRQIRGPQIIGIGGVANRSWYNAGEVKLASGISFPNMAFAGIAKRPSPDSVGTLGAGLFTTYDSDLDFTKGEWRAYPDGRPNFDGLTRIKSHFTRNPGGASIIAEGTVGGFIGDFLLDTGSPGGMSLNGRATRRSGLWDDSKPYAPTQSYGIGPGAVPGRIIRAPRVRIGTYAFENQLVRLDEPGSPTLGQDGLIGLNLLGQLHLTTDVSSESLYIAPNDARVPPIAYAFSGLRLDLDKGKVVIADVGTGSPAAAAGLKKGDRLVGEPRAVALALAGPPGRQVRATVDSDGGKTRDVEFVLRAYL
ncbi:aspartyl protease family protein [Sphingomonas sp. KR3-1]|uniref:aspartyl protease family protein n=1 Tax=Sphingomonas sp. KR3-1 TaxID=3156611 RepID=UPI0032B624F8